VSEIVAGRCECEVDEGLAQSGEGRGLQSSGLYCGGSSARQPWPDPCIEVYFRATVAYLNMPAFITSSSHVACSLAGMIDCIFTKSSMSTNKQPIGLPNRGRSFGPRASSYNKAFALCQHPIRVHQHFSICLAPAPVVHMMTMTRTGPGTHASGFASSASSLPTALVVGNRGQIPVGLSL
jgi:hypothetical protein